MIQSQIHGGISAECIQTTNIVSGTEVMLAYRRARIHSHRSNSRDSFISRSAKSCTLINRRQVLDIWLTRSTKKKNERIWYETDAVKKANQDKANVDDTLKNQTRYLGHTGGLRWSD